MWAFISIYSRDFLFLQNIEGKFIQMFGSGSSFLLHPTHEKNLFWSLKISSWRNRDPCTHVLSIISMGERDSDAKSGIWKFPP